jgi:PTS system mannose-specific IIA component
MIGLVLVAHAHLAAELLAAAELIVGPIPQAEALGIGPGDEGDIILAGITAALKRLGGDGAIIMTDMFGGTPSNLSLSFLEDNRIEVLSGVNLPMVMEFALKRERLGVAELAASLRDCGRESISVAGDFLK